MTRLAVLLIILFWAGQSGAVECPGEGQAYPFRHPPGAIAEALAQAEKRDPAEQRLSGMTVPHHLVAADLIAAGIKAASGHAYDRVVLLSPEHWSRSTRPLSTTIHDFDTPYSRVRIDAEAVGALTATGEVEVSCLFGAEHGVTGILPFIAHYLPGAELVPVAISLPSTRADWDRLMDLLKPIVDERTLVVQSTDFSHYFPGAVARRFDQQVLNVVASGSLDALAALDQPDHLDSIGAMYVQLRLQHDVFGAAPVAMAARNQEHYAGRALVETTGYIVFQYAPRGTPLSRLAAPIGGRTTYLAGDTHFGRAMTPALTDADAADHVAEAVLTLTDGAPLVVNLEGVILPNVPEALPHLTIGMPDELAADWFKRLNVIAVSLANNHARDLGESGLDETLGALDAMGVRHVLQGERIELDAFSLFGLTDLDSDGPPYVDVIEPDMMKPVGDGSVGRPVVAMVHWGREYDAQPRERERDVAEDLRLAGASVILGAHPHVASDGPHALAGGEAALVFSLGNFLFDQGEDVASGSLAELTVFEDGAHFLRLLPLPNLFEIARDGQTR